MADGSHVLFLNTTSGRKFFTIEGVNDSADTVTVTEAPAGTTSGLNWGIGGKRATWDNSDSRQAFADAAGLFWTFETETSQTLTSTISLDDVYVTGASTGIGDRQLVTTSVSNLTFFNNTGASSAVNNLKNLRFTNSNATKTDGEAFLSTAASNTYFYNCEFGDATDQLHKATDRSGGSSNMYFKHCYIHDTVSNGLSTGGGGTIEAYNCVAWNCGGASFLNASGPMTLFNCVVLDSGSTGATSGSSVYSYNCIFHTGTTGISAPNVGSHNTVYYGLTTGIDVTSGTTPYTNIIDINYFGSVTTNTSLAGDMVSTNEIALTADPCTDAANGDATINEATGGGATLRSAAITIGPTETRPFRWLDTSTGGGATNVAAAKFTRLE